MTLDATWIDLLREPHAGLTLTHEMGNPHAPTGVGLERLTVRLIDTDNVELHWSFLGMQGRLVGTWPTARVKHLLTALADLGHPLPTPASPESRRFLTLRDGSREAQLTLDRTYDSNPDQRAVVTPLDELASALRGRVEPEVVGLTRRRVATSS